MITEAIITRLTAIPSCFGLVEGIAALSLLVDGPASSPAGYVFEKESAAGPNERVGAVLQRVEIDIAVVVVTENVAGDHAGAALVESAAIEHQVLVSLLGWQPAGAIEPLTFVSATTVRAKAGIVWRELVFATCTYLEA